MAAEETVRISAGYGPSDSAIPRLVHSLSTRRHHMLCPSGRRTLGIDASLELKLNPKPSDGSGAQAVPDEIDTRNGTEFRKQERRGASNGRQEATSAVRAFLRHEGGHDGFVATVRTVASCVHGRKRTAAEGFRIRRVPAGHNDMRLPRGRQLEGQDRER